MAIVGNNGVVKVSTAASPIVWATPGTSSPTGGTVIGEVRSYSVEATADTIETSVMGNDTRQYVKGMSTWSGTADVYFDGTQFAALQPNKGGVNEVGSNPVFLVFYPRGEEGTTDQIFGGSAIITGYTISASFDGLIEASISFQGSGPLFYQTNG
jgi:predicted secreted protein